MAQHNGTVFLNTDDELLVSKAIGLRTVTYGTPPADLGIRSVSASPSLTLEVEFTNQQQISIHTELYGIYNAANLAAAACIGHYFGVPAQQIVEAIENFTPTNNRSQIVETGKNRLILDAYNANPSSMDAALKAFAAADYPSKTVILGDMLELGDEADQEHRQILSILEGMEPLTVYLVGPRFTRINTKREYQCFSDAALARLWFEHHQPENTTILIKGSRGIRLETITDAL